jgi:signal peptidase II
MIWAIIAISAIALDQLTKLLIINTVDLGSRVTVINNFFYIAHIKNRGAAWGILQNGRIIFIALTIIVVLVLIVLINRSSSRFFKTILSLIIGGALGNFTDRVLSGEVTDFLSFKFGSYEFPIFNVSDIIVVVGTILLAIYIMFYEKNQNGLKYKFRIK